MALTYEEIQKRFGKHAATIEGPNPKGTKHANLRTSYENFSAMLDEVLPEGRNKSLALTALEEASMWSHKAIAND